MSDLTAEISRLEDKAMWAWPPQEVASLNGWLVRGSDGHTNRANSALVLDLDGETSLEQRVGDVETWYQERRLPPCFKLFEGRALDGLDRMLEARGYDRITPSIVLTCAGGREPIVPVDHVEIETRPSQAALNVICHGMAADARAKRAALFSRIKRPQAYGVLFEGGEPVAAGMAVFDDGFGSLAAIMVVPQARRRGHGAAVVARLMVWLKKMGSSQIFIQVEADNEPAVRLYHGLGFADRYRYWYRKRLM